MRKGVSPVIAAVLMIAIAVIASVAVWYWVSPLTAKPPTATTTSVAISVEKCYDNNQDLDIRNVGAVSIPRYTLFKVVDASTGIELEGFNVTLQRTIKSGVASKESVQPGALDDSVKYFLIAPGIPSAGFTC